MPGWRTRSSAIATTRAAVRARFQIEHQIRDRVPSRTVNLPLAARSSSTTRGAGLVDVNSARSTRGSDIEETATRRQPLGVDEIARQMRLRPRPDRRRLHRHGREQTNRREVEMRLRDALRQVPRGYSCLIDQQVRPARIEPPAAAPGALRRQATSPARCCGGTGQPHPRHRNGKGCRSCA